jgi:hypothetical protein
LPRKPFSVEIDPSPGVDVFELSTIFIDPSTNAVEQIPRYQLQLIKRIRDLGPML